MLPIWDAMRMQKGQSNQSFNSLIEAPLYITNFRDMGIRGKPR